ncbi:MAG: hypothetical protein IPF54_20115 [Draconibacterium sp.]|nr:hypothetical protein [Draconibacterium sp.]
MYGLIKIKTYQEAISYGNKALEILKDNPFPSHQTEVDSGMYLANKATGYYKEAIKHLEAYYTQKSALLNENQQQQLNEIHTKFEVKE